MFGLCSRRIYSTTIHHNTDKTEKVVAADLCAFCASVLCCIQNWSRAGIVQRIDVCFVFKEDLLNDHSSKTENIASTDLYDFTVSVYYCNVKCSATVSLFLVVGLRAGIDQVLRLKLFEVGIRADALTVTYVMFPFLVSS